MCCLSLMRSYLQARCPALSHQNQHCHCYCCLGAAMAASWNLRSLLTSAHHPARDPLAQTSAGRLPHMLAHCSHSQKTHCNLILAVQHLAVGTFMQGQVMSWAQQGGAKSHLERFSSRSSLTSLGSCTDTGMMFPGNSGRRGRGTASTCTTQQVTVSINEPVL